MRAALALLLALSASPAWAQVERCTVVIRVEACAETDHRALRAILIQGDNLETWATSLQEAAPSHLREMSSLQTRGGTFRGEGSGSNWKWADDAWWGRDKALHFSASFLLTTNGQYVLVNKLDAGEHAALPASAGGALAIGIAKEVYDARRVNGSGFSLRDLAWNAAGIAAAALLVAL